MRSFVRLFVAASLLSAVTGACLFAYVLGYSDGLKVQSETFESSHGGPRREALAPYPIEEPVQSAEERVLEISPC